MGKIDDKYLMEQQIEEMDLTPNEEYLLSEATINGKEFRMWYISTSDQDVMIEVKDGERWVHWDCLSTDKVAELIISPYLAEEEVI